MRELKLNTTNIHKVAELNRILKTLGSSLVLYPIEKKLEIPELQPSTAQLDLMAQGRYAVVAAEIASAKAHAAFQLHQQAILVEDTILFIDMWKGWPGPVSHFADDPEFLSNLLAAPMRTKYGEGATAITTFAISSDLNEEAQIRQGIVRGQVPLMPQGDSGFGWDSIFIPLNSQESTHSIPENPQLLSYAQVSPAEKDARSMRMLALYEMVQLPFAN
jgi:non-canonical purine NTP pyrophosphatase (RdgB/HAM1 family)